MGLAHALDTPCIASHVRYVYSSIARAAVPEADGMRDSLLQQHADSAEAVVAKLQEQFEAAMRSGSKHGSTRLGAA